MSFSSFCAEVLQKDKEGPSVNTEEGRGNFEGKGNVSMFRADQVLRIVPITPITNVGITDHGPLRRITPVCISNTISSGKLSFDYFFNFFSAQHCCSSSNYECVHALFLEVEV